MAKQHCRRAFEPYTESMAIHVVHLIARLNDGGPARVLQALARALPAHGVRVSIIAGRCAADEPDLSDALRAAGCEVHTLESLGRRAHPWRDLRAAWQLNRLLARLRPDLLHTHTAKAGLLGRVLGAWRGLGVLHTYHGHVLNAYFPRIVSLALVAMERLLAQRAHHQALTAGQLDTLARRYGIGRPTTWHLLPIPVPPVQRQEAAWHERLDRTRPVIVFLGRLAPVKDADRFLDTIAIIARRRPVQGLICGDGTLRSHLERRVQREGLPVHFTGFVPAGEALAVADMLLITSRNEGLPLTAVEAAGCGVPVVAPPVGGLRDCGRWGLVRLARRRPAALAAAVLRQLDQGDACHRARAAMVARELAPERLAAAYAALYHELMARKWQA